MSGITAFVLLIVLPVASLGSLLPTWMFVNSLQLVAHLPLLNMSLPANAHIFMIKFLDLVRWYDKELIESIG